MRKQRVQLVFPHDFVERVDKRAKIEKRSRNSFLLVVVERYLNETEALQKVDDAAKKVLAQVN